MTNYLVKVLVLIQSAIMLYFIYSAPLFRFVFFNYQNVPISINFVFVLLSFTTILLIALLTTIVMSEINVQEKTAKAVIGFSSILSVIQVYVIYSFTLLMKNGGDYLLLTKNIALNRIWTFNEKFQYLFSYLELSSLDYSIINNIVNESNSFQALKEKADIALKEKNDALQVTSAVTEQLNDHGLFTTVLCVGGVVAIICGAIYFYGKGSTPPPGGTTSNNVTVAISNLNNNTGVSSNLTSMDWAWDKFGIVKDEMSKYFNFGSQKNISETTLSQHENFVPITTVTTNFDKTSSGLIHKTYLNFLNSFESNNNNSVPEMFNYIYPSGDVLPIDLNQIVSAPTNFFIQAVPLNVVSYMEKLELLSIWIQTHELEINIGLGSVLALGYFQYLSSEEPLTDGTEVLSHNFNFMENHSFLRFLELISTDINEENGLFMAEGLCNKLEIIPLDYLFINFRQVLELNNITEENMISLKDMCPDVFVLVAYKAYAFLYTQLEYLSAIANNSGGDPDIVEPFENFAHEVSVFSPTIVDVFSNMNII